MSDRKWHWTWRCDLPQWWHAVEYNWVEFHFADIYVENARYLGRRSWEFVCVVLGFGLSVETYLETERNEALAPILAMRDDAASEGKAT